MSDTGATSLPKNKTPLETKIPLYLATERLSLPDVFMGV
jgi:hypothetical protein